MMYCQMESHGDDLPPPPPLPPNVEPIKAESADDLPPPPPVKPEEAKKISKPKRALIARPGFGKRGNPIQLVTNHFKVSLKTTDEFFHHYYVCLYILVNFLCCIPLSLFTLFVVEFLVLPSDVIPPLFN